MELWREFDKMKYLTLLETPATAYGNIQGLAQIPPPFIQNHKHVIL